MTNLSSTKTLEEFKKITDAEGYFQFFELEYDQRFVNINRLHILKKFSLLIEAIDETFAALDEQEKLSKYGEALAEAYELFQSKTSLDTKLFKVFQDRPKNVVLLQDIETE
ncbi:MAG: nitrogenase-stabilizing/protective protein NifW [Prochloraceae cyanobacterium]|nr:nitrogenase-stabilizing/protective protein NifW [Prochloraceae cyanobacterium]